MRDTGPLHYPFIGYANSMIRLSTHQILDLEPLILNQNPTGLQLLLELLNLGFHLLPEDSFGAFLHPSMRTGTIFSISATLTPALSGLPPWP